MNIQILAVGKPKAQFFEQAIQEYVKRLGRWVKIELKIMPVSNIDNESLQLLAALPKDAYTVLLDERGQGWSTKQLAEKLNSLQNGASKNLIFIIGGAYGFTDDLRQKADVIWSLSALTFPHELARLILVEQLYRAYNLNAGGHYHHD